MFQTSNTSLSIYLLCNSKTHVINLYLDYICVVLFVIGSVLTTHMDSDYD
jgi:hypothetical protein